MKRFLSLLLCGALAVCAAGCGRAPAAAQAAGRYVEREITPPGAQEKRARGLFQLADGRLCYLAGDLDWYESGDGGATWQPQNTDWYEELCALAGSREIALCLDGDGAVWAAAPAQDGIGLFYKGEDGLRQIGTAGAESGTRPLQLRIGADQSVFVLALSGGGTVMLVIDGASGQVKQQFSVEPGADFGVRGEKLELFTAGGEQVTYDLAGGQETARRPLGTGALGALGPDGAVWAVSAEGLSLIAAGGSVTEDLFAGTGNRFQAPDTSLRGVLPLQDGTLCVAYDTRGGSALCLYTYDPDALVRGENSLVVWSLRGSLTLNAAISAFKEENPQVDVVLELGRENGDAGLSDADIIRSLNAALLTGDAPDLLILDGLPADSLMEKGLLEDLTGLVEEADYFENLFTAWTLDGKTYAYPARVQLPVLLAQAGTRVENGSLSALAAAAAAGRGLPAAGEVTGLAAADQPLLYFDDWRALFDVFYAAAAPRLLTDKGCDEAALTELFSATGAISEKYGLTAEPSGRVSGAVMDLDGGQEYYFPLQIEAYKCDAACQCAVLLEDLANLNGPFWLRDTQVALMPGGAFLPRISAAVPVNAAQKELAKKFVGALLSQPVQAAKNYYEGLPVRREALAALQEQLRQSIRHWQEQHPENSYPAGLVFDSAALLSGAGAASKSNDQLKETIYEQATKFYDKSCTLEQAVANAMEATQLYFEERR